ncbi:hypothetical protein BOX15_Mlig022392g1, partial [Macrostomum lignano]
LFISVYKYSHRLACAVKVEGCFGETDSPVYGSCLTSVPDSACSSSPYFYSLFLNLHGHDRDRMATARLDRFVRENFQQLRCNKYVKSQESEERICGCNRDERWHADCGVPVTPLPSREGAAADGPLQWDSAACCLRLPTNAHGRIKFRGFGRLRSANCPKFIRIQSTGIDMEALWALLTDKDKWALPYPDFVLSVNGGAGNFLGFSRKFSEKLKAAVLNITAGVRKVWIFTHGFNVGVAGQFGQVLEQASFVGSDVSNIFLIGISTWGNIYNNQMLEDDENYSKGGATLPGEHMRRYDYEKGELDKDSSLKRLDKNHTHFIMVDDGSEGCSGREIQLRTELEKFVVTKMRTIGARSGRPCIPPVVQLCVEGGKFTLLTAAQAAQEGTPVIAVRGSGRAADQLVWADEVRRLPAASRPSEAEVRAQIKHLIGEFVNTSGPMERRALEKALFRFAYESTEAFPMDLLTVFDPIEDTDLSRSVLYLVFRHPDFKDDTMTQVVLAMSWDRADIAESEIFSAISESQLRELNMNRLFIKALMYQQKGFIELFMDYGVSAVNVLNRERMERLYLKFITQGTQQSERLLARLIQTRDNMESCKCSGGAQKPHKFSMSCGIEEKEILLLIGRIIKTLTNDVLDNIYTEAYLTDNPSADPTKDLYPPRKRDGSRKFNLQDLFIWAILCHNMELAVLFWKNGKNQISTALIGRLLLQHMAEDADSNDEMELKSVFEADSQRFEELALGVLAKCYERNRDITKAVLIRELPMWNSQTPLAIAEGSQCLDFMHHSSVQDLLTMIWMGGMVTNTATWRIITCLFLPFLTPFLIFKTHRKFNYMHIHEWCKQERSKLNQSTVSLDNQEKARLINVLEDVQVVDKSAVNTREYLETIMVDEVVESLEVSLKTRQQMRMESLYQKRQGFMNLSFLSCLQLFFMSPLVKCILNCLSTLMFLSMLSYIVLVELGQRCDPASRYTGLNGSSSCGFCSSWPRRFASSLTSDP